jgi:PilZ domain
VSGQTEDGKNFEEKALVRDISIQGAYLCLGNRPRLQSELRVVIETSGDAARSAPISLRANVVHFDESRDGSDAGVGVVFVEEPDARRNRD